MKSVDFIKVKQTMNKAPKTATFTNKHYWENLPYNIGDNEDLSHRFFHSEIVTVDRKASFARDILPYFGGIFDKLEIDEVYWFNIYCDHPVEILTLMTMVKYYTDMCQYLQEYCSIGQAGFCKDIEAVIENLKSQDLKTPDITLCVDFAKRYDLLCSKFIEYKNKDILNSARELTVELQTIELPMNVKLSPPNICLELTEIKGEIPQFDSVDINDFPELYDLQEPPYIKEQRILAFLRPMFHINEIFDPQQDQVSLPQLLPIKEFGEYYHCQQYLLGIDSFDEGDFRILLENMLSHADKILSDTAIVSRLALIKQQSQKTQESTR
jgi:hypothetical protein